MKFLVFCAFHVSTSVLCLCSPTSLIYNLCDHIKTTVKNGTRYTVSGGRAVHMLHVPSLDLHFYFYTSPKLAFLHEQPNSPGSVLTQTFLMVKRLLINPQTLNLRSGCVCLSAACLPT